jgi:hypothetical protein
MYMRVGVGLIAMILLAAIVAAEGSQQDIQKSQKQVYYDQSRVEQTRRTLDAFSHAVDLWHDAYLKGDAELIAKYEEQLEELVDTDLKHTRSEVTRQQRQVAQAAMVIERREGNRHWEERVEARGDLREEEHDFHRAQNWLSVKKRLSASIAKTEAFSNRLRLFNTYTEALRRQLESEGLELAEDMRELERDAERFVLEKQD